jgi:hypothetical protein
MVPAQARCPATLPKCGTSSRPCCSARLCPALPIKSLCSSGKEVCLWTLVAGYGGSACYKWLPQFLSETWSVHLQQHPSYKHLKEVVASMREGAEDSHKKKPPNVSDYGQAARRVHRVMQERFFKTTFQNEREQYPCTCVYPGTHWDTP